MIHLPFCWYIVICWEKPHWIQKVHGQGSPSPTPSSLQFTRVWWAWGFTRKTWLLESLCCLSDTCLVLELSLHEVMNVKGSGQSVKWCTVEVEACGIQKRARFTLTLTSVCTPSCCSLPGGLHTTCLTSLVLSSWPGNQKLGLGVHLYFPLTYSVAVDCLRSHPLCCMICMVQEGYRWDRH